MTHELVSIKDIPFDAFSESEQAAAKVLMTQVTYRDPFLHEQSVNSAQVQNAIGQIKSSAAFKQREADKAAVAAAEARQAKDAKAASEKQAIMEALYAKHSAGGQ